MIDEAPVRFRGSLLRRFGVVGVTVVVVAAGLGAQATTVQDEASAGGQLDATGGATAACGRFHSGVAQESRLIGIDRDTTAVGRAFEAAGDRRSGAIKVSVVT